MVSKSADQLFKRSHRSKIFFNFGKLTFQKKMLKYNCYCLYLFFKNIRENVRIFLTPWTAACQAPLSMGFSRQEYWSGWPCPPPGNLPDLLSFVSCTSKQVLYHWCHLGSNISIFWMEETSGGNYASGMLKVVTEQD